MNCRTFCPLICPKYNFQSTWINLLFLTAHPDIIVEKKSDSPDEDKSLADSKALLPVLIDFFQKHPLIEPKTFLGDSAFDAIEIYKSLFEDIGFRKAFIPLRVKLSMEPHVEMSVQRIVLSQFCMPSVSWHLNISAYCSIPNSSQQVFLSYP